MQYKNSISVIVPVYNSEKTIKKCIESIVNQSYNDWFLILVDDGSTDQSPEICDDYAKNNKRIKVIHKSNGGVSSARNSGIEIVNTEYITFVDGDDYIDENYLKSLMGTASLYPNANIWCSFSVLKDNCLVRDNTVSKDDEISLFNRNQVMTLHKLWQIQGPYCKLYKADVILSNNIKFNTAYSFGEDLMFNLDYLDLCNNDIVILNKNLYSYVQTENGLNSKYKENELELVNSIYSYIKLYMDKWKVGKEQYEIFYNSCYGGYDNAIINIANNKNINIFNKSGKIKKILKDKNFKIAFKNKTCRINFVLNILYKYKLSLSAAIFYIIVEKV